MSRPTPQTLDPLGGLTARYFLLATCVVTAVVAALMLWAHQGDISSAALQSAALIVFTGALIQAIIAADPQYFPFGPVRHALVFATLLLAAALDAASRPDGVAQAGTWAPVCIAIILFLSGSFRPYREVLIVSFVVAVGVGIITFLHLGALAPADAAQQVTRAVTPIVAIGAGTAGFSRVLVTRLSRWQRDHQLVPPSDLAAAVEVQRVRQDFVDYRVGPFLESLLEADSLTPVDAARARGLAAGLRQQMLRDASRSWLSDAVDRFEGDRTIVDSLTADQRRALGAIIAELRADDSLIENSVGAVARPGPPATIELSAALDTSGLRAPAYRAVLGAAFARARVDITPTAVSIVAQLAR
ncbi:hypothetical protein [Antiquaquibacter soli]|uniref:FUSC family protein n=1 Tax=Antiquaquibacter soli TaxID=3064523 RepID=A0ABT9BLM1_9MICO|nr:hypothetical protein [Protaetiibacter sp. WY-16]MDO7880676.1 hypothetical protein [Protaetiibacter sp. WY-16]